MSTQLTNKAKVAVIVPMFNDSEFLSGCLDSILAQTAQDWEAWLIDDRSEDDSAAIAQTYCDRDARFRLLKNEKNSSAWVCRAKGILAASDSVKYIMFADADDAMQPNAVERVCELMEEQPVDILNFGTNVVFTTELPSSTVTGYPGTLEPTVIQLKGREVFEHFVERRFEGHLWNRAFNAQYLKEIITRYGADRFFPKAQDKALYWAVCCGKKDVTYRGVSDRLYDYYYGRGVEGGDTKLDLMRFRQYLAQAYVEDFVAQVMADTDRDPESYRDILDRSRYSLIHHSVKNYVRLHDELKADGLRLMSEYWTDPLDKARITCCLAEYTWNEQPHYAEIFRGSEFFRTKKSGKDIKVIGTYYHRMDNGGIQQVISKLVEFWHKSGYEIVLFSDADITDNDYNIPDYVKRVKVDLIFSQCTGDNYHKRGMSIARLIQEHNVDCMVYHAYFGETLLYDTCICKCMNTPFVLYYHNVFSRFIRYNDARFSTIPMFSKMANAVVCLDEISCQWWKMFNPNSRVVLNPLTFELSKTPVAKRNSQNILFLCRLQEESKRPNDAIDIMKLVLQRVPDAKLYVVGSGEKHTEDKMNMRIEKLGLADSIFMCGFHREVEEYYKKCSLFLSCSSHEGAPMTLCESLSYGVPIVMYNLPYLVISGNPGVTSVPQCNFETAADAICELLLNNDKLIAAGNAGRQALEELYRTDIGAQWETLFNDIKPEESCAMLPVNIGEVLIRDYYDGVCNTNNSGKNTNSEDARVLRRKLKHCSDQLNDIRNSVSFRVGRIITFIPRKIRDFFRKKK